MNIMQDYVNCKEFPYKVNAISIAQFSDQLKKLCIESGGKQIRITEGFSTVKGYSSECPEGEVIKPL